MMADFYVPAGGQDEFWTDERCFITEFHNNDASPETSLALARVEAGVTTQLHSLTGVIERYIVRKGEGILEVGLAGRGRVADHRPGSWLAWSSIGTIGRTTVLVFQLAASSSTRRTSGGTSASEYG